MQSNLLTKFHLITPPLLSLRIFLGRCYFRFAICKPNFQNYSGLSYARTYRVCLYVRQDVQGSAHTLDLAHLSSTKVASTFRLLSASCVFCATTTCFYYSMSTNILLLLIGIIGHAYSSKACLFKVANSTSPESCCCCSHVRVLIVQNALCISILLSYFSFIHFPPNRVLVVCFIVHPYTYYIHFA